MADTTDIREDERQYLLGTLTQADKAHLESTFFSDDEKFEQLEAAEDDLIDAYVRDELSPEDKQSFRTLLGSPRIVERVNFARVFAERTSSSVPSTQAVQPQLSADQRPQESRIPWWENFFGLRPRLRFAFANGVVLILFSGVSLTVWFNSRKEFAQLGAESAAVQQQKAAVDKQLVEQQGKVAQLEAELQNERDRLAAALKLVEDGRHGESEKPTSFLGTIASIALLPGGSRGGPGSDLKIGPATSTAQLKLELGRSTYPAYNVSINDPNEVVKFSRRGIKARKTSRGYALFVSVPAKNLPPDDYIVYVDGVTASRQVERIYDYAFRILKSQK